MTGTMKKKKMKMAMSSSSSSSSRCWYNLVKEDIIMDKILLKLPVSSLLSLRCVSRYFHSLITSPGFIKKHLDHNSAQPNHNNLLLIISSRFIRLSPSVGLKEVYRHCAINFCDDPSYPQVVEMHLPFEESASIQASCNGLLYLHKTISKTTSRGYVWNPRTKEYKVVPPPPPSTTTPSNKRPQSPPPSTTTPSSNKRPRNPFRQWPPPPPSTATPSNSIRWNLSTRPGTPPSTTTPLNSIALNQYWPPLPPLHPSTTTPSNSIPLNQYWPPLPPSTTTPSTATPSNSVRLNHFRLRTVSPPSTTTPSNSVRLNHFRLRTVSPPSTTTPSNSARLNPFTPQLPPLLSTTLSRRKQGLQGIQVCSSGFCGFGYDGINDEYKILYFENRVDLVSFGVTISEYKLYKLGTNTWTSVSDNNPYRHLTFGLYQTIGLFVNGALHWIMSPSQLFGGRYAKIISFDMEKEKFGELQKPRHRYTTDKTSYGGLQVLQGCLCLSEFPSDLNTTYIWILKDYAVKDSWTKLFTIEFSREDSLGKMHFKLLRLCENGEIVLARNHQYGIAEEGGRLELDRKYHNDMIVYDPVKHISRRVENLDEAIKKHWTYEVIYTESLVSLNSGTFMS